MIYIVYICFLRLLPILESIGKLILKKIIAILIPKDAGLNGITIITIILELDDIHVFSGYGGQNTFM